MIVDNNGIIVIVLYCNSVRITHDKPVRARVETMLEMP